MSALRRVIVLAVGTFALAIAGAFAQVGPIPGMGPLTFLPQPGGSVAFDAVGSSATGVYAGLASSVSTTTLTIGTGNFRGLTAQLSLAYVTASPVSGVGCTWNSVALTSLITPQTTTTGTHTLYASLWGLTGPASGSQTLACSWTGTATDSILQGESFTGVNPAGGTTSFPNCVGALNSTTTLKVTVTSATSNMVVDDASSIAQKSTNTGTLTYYNTSGTIENGIGQYQAGSSSVSLGYTMTSNNPGVIVGCSIAP
jgi:hypothetical protein